MQKLKKKNRGIAFLLSFFFGMIGLDRFYMGYFWMGILKMFTGGVFGILWFADMFRIASGSLKPAEGYTFEDTPQRVREPVRRAEPPKEAGPAPITGRQAEKLVNIFLEMYDLAAEAETSGNPRMQYQQIEELRKEVLYNDVCRTAADRFLEGIKERIAHPEYRLGSVKLIKALNDYADMAERYRNVEVNVKFEDSEAGYAMGAVELVEACRRNEILPAEAKSKLIGMAYDTERKGYRRDLCELIRMLATCLENDNTLGIVKAEELLKELWYGSREETGYSEEEVRVKV